MASTFSTNLAIELIGTGDQAGTWGTTTNSNLGTLIEQAISGYVTQAVATGTDTTITIPNGSTGVARNMYIELTGTGGASTNLIVPANKKLYFIFNNSTGAVTVKVSGQTGVSVPTGKKMVLVSNGTDIVNGLNYIADFGTNSFSVTNLTASSATITNLIATSGSITNLVSSDASATVLRAGSATLTHLSATSVSITNVSVASATVSSNLTLSGGTANGVAFLNASKVVTAGSALTFDGTQTFNLFATGNAVTNLEGSATNNAILRFRNGTTGALAGFYGNNSKELIFEANGTTEQMRLTSTGLGIGTASPGAKLQVSGTAKVGTGAASNSATFMVNNPNATATGIQLFQDSQESWIMGLLASSTALTWANSGSEKMRLDTSGNLGIGTASPSAKLTVFAGADGNIGFFRGGGIRQLQLGTSSTAGYLNVDNATSGFELRLNGTAQAYLDSSGNLGLGVTPSAWNSGAKAFQLNATPAFWSFSNNLYLSNNRFFDTGGTNKYIANGFATTYEQSSGQHIWLTAPSGTAGNAISFTQAMTLDASGNLALGGTSNKVTGLSGSGTGFTVQATAAPTIGVWDTSDASYYLQLGQIDANSYLWNIANGFLSFGTNNTERARIAADGQFSASTSLAGSNLISFTNSSTTGYGISMSVNNDSSGTYRYFEGFSQSASAQRIAIYTNGDVKNTNGVFAAFSDVKLKKDIVDAGSQWDDIKALRVRKYKLKNDTSDVVQIGLIAQEVEQVSPGLVNESQDETRDEDGQIVLTGEVTKGVKYSILYMKAVKALQEAMARIETLEAKVTALESK